MKQVDLLLPTSKPFSFERYMQKELQKAFKELGVSTRSVIFDQRETLEYFATLEEEPPLFSLAFSEMLSLKHPEIPHFYWEYRSLGDALPLLRHPQNSLGYGCRTSVFHCQKFGGQSHFFPPATSKVENLSSERPYDVVLFDDLVDTNALKQTWEELYPDAFTANLHMIVRKCHENPLKHPLQIILSLHLEESVNDLLYLVEEYLKAERVYALIEAFEGLHIHVFGEHIGNNWYTKLKNPDHLHLHSTLPYAQPYNDYLEILQMSKILIRDQMPYRDGCDEWLFPALSHGCLPLTYHNLYLEQELGHDLPLAKNRQELQQNVHTYLNDFTRRENCLKEVQEKVLVHHTFEKRALQLMEIMKCG